jgi:NAD(P)-dependent dehydrogenase (short-subunit alcohol dehydrogenase family)
MSMWRLAAAGLFALPAVVVTLVVAPIVALLSIPACWLLSSPRTIPSRRHNNIPKNNNNKDDAKCSSTTTTSSSNNNSKSAANNKQWERQVIVTGGSSGIGLAIACAAAAAASADNNDNDTNKPKPTRIVLLARTKDKLAAARETVQAAAATAWSSSSSSSSSSSPMVVVETISVDVSNADAVEKAARSVMSSSSNVITHLFVCAAGEPHVLKFQDTSLSQYTSVTQTNQLGSIYVAHAFANLMTTGTITLTSSMAGQVGVFGYSAYSPTKFACRSLANGTRIGRLCGEQKYCGAIGVSARYRYAGLCAGKYPQTGRNSLD